MVITLLMAIFAVLFLQALAQLLCVRWDARKFPPPGRIINTSRGSMHVRQMGSGGPAIILEAGIAASSLNWSILQPQLAEFATTYSYDRLVSAGARRPRGNAHFRKCLTTFTPL
ncbi:MAG: hypothetical protein WCE73_00635 [Candidatus Angelobacter sp.]